jgi:hypothetical protein
MRDDNAATDLKSSWLKTISTTGSGWTIALVDMKDLQTIGVAA